MSKTIEITVPDRAAEVISWLDDSFGETLEEKTLAFIQFGMFNIPNRCFEPPAWVENPEDVQQAMSETQIEGEPVDSDSIAASLQETTGEGPTMDPLVEGVSWLYEGEERRNAKIRSQIGPWMVEITSNSDGQAMVKMEPPQGVRTFDEELHEKAAAELERAVQELDEVAIINAHGGADHSYFLVELDRAARPALGSPQGWTPVESDK